MDLSERGQSQVRHPWESARYAFIQRVIGSLPKSAHESVLDFGAGDAWLAKSLINAEVIKFVVCVDSNYSISDVRQIQTGAVTARSDLPGQRFSLILLLDVLEHVADPRHVLSSLRKNNCTGETYVLVTVPAHAWLFSSHDVALRHFRRYSRRELIEQLSAEFRIVQSGYLFTIPLVGRIISTAYRKTVKATGSPSTLGTWQFSTWTTKLITSILEFDIRVGGVLNRLGIVVPGLSCWALAKVDNRGC